MCREQTLLLDSRKNPRRKKNSCPMITKIKHDPNTKWRYIRRVKERQREKNKGRKHFPGLYNHPFCRQKSTLFSGHNKYYFCLKNVHDVLLLWLRCWAPGSVDCYVDQYQKILRVHRKYSLWLWNLKTVNVLISKSRKLQVAPCSLHSHTLLAQDWGKEATSMHDRTPHLYS